MVKYIRVSRDFIRYPDADLDEFTGNIIDSLTDNPAFPTPPVSLTELGTLHSAFHAALVAALGGGRQLTAAKNTAQAQLLDALRKEANYVETIASRNLDVLLSSGFNPVSTNRAQTPLPKPVIAAIENVASTQLLVRLQPINTAKSYVLQVSTGTGAWQDAGIFTQARRIVLENLVSGTTYNVRARAIGGATGTSEWSDPVGRIVT